jgi:hypothetical protein
MSFSLWDSAPGAPAAATAIAAAGEWGHGRERRASRETEEKGGSVWEVAAREVARGTGIREFIWAGTF